ncbi:hypothetical protein [Archangium lipolyticum]|uniref:hypothetical protein n=1 Tax=Archangium lipolyticum TaxID=2970465 RepID=UPI002149BF1B|nr:hypothetical protein [Archangium lipolyticum]
MPPPPSKPKVPTKGVPLGEDDEAPTQMQPRKIALPRTQSRESERTVVGRPAWSGGDGFETSEVKTSPGRPAFTGDATLPGRPAFTGVAPEVRKSLFHDRSAPPRGLLPSEALLAGLDEALQKAAQLKAPVAAVRGQLKKDWLPLLRLAVEQAGGDGMDAYVTQLLAPPGRKATSPLLGELASGMERLEAAADVSALSTVAQEIRAMVARALGDPSPRAISLKLLESELDGRVEVDAMLSIRFASNAELETRRAEAEKTLEELRKQMQVLTGKPPGGIFSNFARVKVEKRVMDAEVRRRGVR